MCSVAPTIDALERDQLWGHPKGLYVCFATELWERFSFYGMKYLLLLYLTKYHLFTDDMGYDVLGAYAGLVYALPVIGGLLADRYLGMRKAVVFGGILLSLGHILMAVEGDQAVAYTAGTVLSQALTLSDGTVFQAGHVLTEDIVNRDVGALNVFYLALALIVMGVGYLKPNISTIVGKLYPQDAATRDSGFTIFYMGINIGSLTATLTCGWLGETYGWGYGFGAAGMGMILGLITFLKGQKYLYGHADPSNPEKLKEKVLGPVNKEWAIYLLTIPALIGVWWLVQDEPVVHTTQNSLLIVAIVGLILYSMFFSEAQKRDPVAILLALISVALGLTWAIFEPGKDQWLGAMFAAVVVFAAYGFWKHNSPEYSRTVVLMVLILSTIVFWALFEQSAGSMTLYADRVTDREVINSGFQASEAWKFYLPGGLIVLLGLGFFARTWKWVKANSGDTMALVGAMLIIVGLAGTLGLGWWLATTNPSYAWLQNLSYLGVFLLLILAVLPVVAFAFLMISFFYFRANDAESKRDEVDLTASAVGIISAVILAIGGYLLLYGTQLAGSGEEGKTLLWMPTASQFGSLNALFIVLLAPIFAAIWIFLGKRGREPSTPVKFALGIIQAGLGFGALVLGAQYPDAAGKVAAIWLVLAYLLHTTGELCLSPVGLSAVTKLSIPRVVGASMGTWFLATALSETVATRLGKQASIETVDGEIVDIAAALGQYTELFETLMWWGIGTGVVLLILSPFLRRGMHGVH